MASVAAESSKPFSYPSERMVCLSEKADVWAVKGLFHLGAGQKEGLTYAGLRERMLGALDKNPWVFDKDDPKQESSDEQLAEERAKADLLRAGDEPFPLDTTMTIVKHPSKAAEDGTCVIISPVPWTSDLEVEILEKAGHVEAVVCPNLQHWLYALQWARRFPAASVWVAPSAHGEDVAAKLRMAAAEIAPEGKADSVLATDAVQVLTTDSEAGPGSRVSPSLKHRLLDGASLAMNEILFLHEASGTLIASDGAYTGYSADAPSDQQPQWFGRLWFKLTKPSGSFRKPEMPVYRTMRVQSHGDPVALRDSVLSICKDWEFTQIVCAHGTVPHTGCREIGDAKAVFKHLWYSGCGLDKLDEVDKAEAASKSGPDLSSAEGRAAAGGAGDEN